METEWGVSRNTTACGTPVSIEATSSCASSTEMLSPVLRRCAGGIVNWTRSPSTTASCTILIVSTRILGPTSPIKYARRETHRPPLPQKVVRPSGLKKVALRSAMREGSMRMTPSAPTERARTEILLTSSEAASGRTTVERLSITMKSLPPPDILKNSKAFSSGLTGLSCRRRRDHGREPIASNVRSAALVGWLGAVHRREAVIVPDPGFYRLVHITRLDR